MQSTIIIADDHALATEGIKSILSAESEISIIAEADNGISAIALIRKHKPTCAIIDLAMPGANGIEVLTEAKRWTPETKIIVVTGNQLPQQFNQLIKAGVEGIILKNSPPEEILANIRIVLNGGNAFPDNVKSILDHPGLDRSISKRETEILIGISRGLSNAKIAVALGLSPKTVDSHRTNLMRKFEVNSVATLLVKALKEGYLDA